ncbi:MAG: PilZ domain-containing protein [Porphyrobacter sp.]|nr:PilZ domain-containing protein [Porphyrobacter sp.]
MSRLNVFGGADPRRTHSRLGVNFVARLKTVSGLQEVRLLDLSRGGAHFVLSRPEKVRDGILSWLQYEAFGGAVWQKGDRVGLEFDRPIPLPYLVETRKLAPSVVSEEAVSEA